MVPQVFGSKLFQYSYFISDLNYFIVGKYSFSFIWEEALPCFSCIIFSIKNWKLFSIYLKTKGQKLMLVTRHGNSLNVALYAYLLKFIQANEEGISITLILQQKLLGFLQGIHLFVVLFLFSKVRKPSTWVSWYLHRMCSGPQSYAANCCEWWRLLPAWFCFLELISVQVIFLQYI